ncbi:FMN-dependent oxidoreductase (nitrilotriacetate monooxygenase family) [Bradyrhizobium sp. USDA 4524]|uniref:LLM class flavin-dependent oxidoreductase n=1 Tax=unclassified Bradyrhizobium TaxID=2631580 RepID=UPI0020A0D3AB|nr:MULTISPECIES: LLM class flavin-dependent oxidoreductase [unclassified Bradyrhizobium]MCP1845566.1 FMN-dependent oxidoreductase (nitrilotriacetate monooxygenase family) [Bradyrhizobium sp. USDA 4538]MCP1907112.1 FMN-dependent oxidoreductase (nitrilotriacetate monooxygenase family) [Bradyrhizobium sp. USDA 4537]MCP1985587.1 FMN-dependent oxidoreductase (nitrilotriacetate monooxygenase family) [Bradyrhizobium sp. USDA 4539]
MPKEIRLNAFDMNSVGHIQHGMWSHPRDQSPCYTDIEYWQHLARTAERGLFDSIFLADIIGVYDVYDGSPAASIRGAVQIPINDPLLVVPVMAAVTRNISFGVTSNATYETPYLFARRLSTLDHLTKGRAGWNVVTGYLDSAARAMGLERQIEHDDRYDLADDYMEAMYKLLEGSWEDDAVVADRVNRIYADPAKVHAINHIGRRHRFNAIHLSEPSPQRTPVLFQAGVSTRGRAFAARHAECIFLATLTKDNVRALVKDVRAQAVRNGRSPEDIVVFASRAIVVGRTRKEAEEKFADYKHYGSVEGALAHFASSVGIDYAKEDLDAPLQHEHTNAMQSILEALTTRSSEQWTLRKLLGEMGLGSRTKPFVGSAEEVADEFQGWVEDTGIDGFNLSRVVAPDGLEDFVDLVVPILQERGVYKTSYREGTLRQKLFGRSARLPEPHTGGIPSAWSRNRCRRRTAPPPAT